MKLIIIVLGLFLASCQTSPTTGQDQTQLVNTYVQLATSYLEQNRTGMALERASRAINLAPENVQANYVYGLAHQQNKKYTTASMFFKKALDLSGGRYPAAKNAYAVTLCRQGEIDQAHRLLNELIYDNTYATPDFARENLKKCHV